jgi:outer membrane protein assembly factor BamB
MALSAHLPGILVSHGAVRQRPRDGYARIIGRVGALAVFLGVGTALAVPGVAAADTGESGSSSSSTSGSASPSKSEKSDSRNSASDSSTSDNKAADNKAADNDSSDRDDSDRDNSAAESEVTADDADAEKVASKERGRNASAKESDDADDSDVEDTVVVDVAQPEAPAADPDPEPAPAIAGVVSIGATPRRDETSESQGAAETAVTTAVNSPVAQNVLVNEAVASTVAPPPPFLPYTMAAIKNAFEVVFTHPFEVLARPITATVFVVSSVTNGFLTDIGLAPALPYARTGWVTLHGDPANRKLQPGVDLSQNYNKWSALQGASILAAPTILPNGNVVVTTGVAAGGSNLHVIDRNGDIVWQAAAWSGDTGVDSGAVLSSPIIDRAGNIYVSDGDQFWSFTHDGAVRWVSLLPEAPDNDQLRPGSRNINPFITATLTHDGSVLGVTTYGHIVVFDGATGELAAPILQIPGPLAARAATDPPAPLWAGGFMDPEIIDPIWQVAFGGLYRTTNTPGVDSKTGRVFVAATDVEAGKGALYALDYVPATPFSSGKIRVAFTVQMGPGSGSSPTVSADGRSVYASDDAGLLYAFSTRTGKLLWSTQSNAEAASVAVDRKGNIYVLTRNDVMSSFDSAGNRRWVADVSELTQQLLPVSPVLGAPVAIGGGNPTVVNGRIVQAVVYGYNFVAQGRTIFVPVKATLVEFDPVTGKGIRNLVDTNEGTEGILNIAPDGRMYASLGAITTTSVAPLAPLINTLLPAGFKVLTPSGGFNGFTPAAG